MSDKNVKTIIELHQLLDELCEICVAAGYDGCEFDCTVYPQNINGDDNDDKPKCFGEISDWLWTLGLYIDGTYSIYKSPVGEMIGGYKHPATLDDIKAFLTDEDFSRFVD